MPLLDHFHAPLSPQRHWESFHVNWAGAIADALNDRLLPQGYFAEEHARLGARIEIDVATFGTEPTDVGSVATTTTRPRVWIPPEPTATVSASFPDSFEVLITRSEGGTTLVAAIELVSPANKDRESHRVLFTSKCAAYLAQGISLIVIDIVTSRQANLHNDLMALLGQSGVAPLAEDALYATAYRPAVRESGGEVDVWAHSVNVGGTLPVLPLALDAETVIPVDLEETYSVARQRRRLG
jgi:hypothetical protein